MRKIFYILILWRDATAMNQGGLKKRALVDSPENNYFREE